MDKALSKQASKWIQIAARIWSIPVIAFSVMMLSGYFVSWVTTGTADPYAVEDVAPIEFLPPLFLFAASLSLAVAWKWERVGAFVSVAFSSLASVSVLVQEGTFESFRKMTPLFLILIVAIPGILFLIHSSQVRDNGK